MVENKPDKFYEKLTNKFLNIQIEVSLNDPQNIKKKRFQLEIKHSKSISLVSLGPVFQEGVLTFL